MDLFAPQGATNDPLLEKKIVNFGNHIKKIFICLHVIK